MRNKVMLLLLVPVLPAFAQFLPDQRLTNDGAESYTTNNNAWAVAASGNNVHVVWFDRRNANVGNPWNFEIYYKRSTDAGKTWGNDVQLTNDTARSYFPAVAVRRDTVNVVWQDYRPGDGVGKSRIWYRRSTNNGAEWSGDYQLTSSSGEAENPCVAVRGPYVHVVWDDNRDGNRNIHYRRSTDWGASWGTETKLSHGDGGSYLPSLVACSLGLHVAWEDNRDGNREIYYLRSLDNGGTWGSDDRQLTTDGANSLGPCIAAADGLYGTNVNVLWCDDRGGHWNLRRITSLNSGTDWGTDQAVTNNTSSACFETPSLVASGTDFYSVWAGDSGTAGNFEIGYARYAGSFDPHARLTSAGGHSEYPSIARAGEVLHVVWQDERNTGNYEIYYKRGSTSALGWSWLTDAASTFGQYSWLAYGRSGNKLYAYFDPNGDDFRSYRFSDGTWSASYDLTAEAGAGCCACVDGFHDSCYAVVGGGTSFFRYHGGGWSAMTAVPTAVTSGGSCVYASGATTAKVYVLTGGASGTCKLYAYIPSSSPPSWSGPMPTPPGSYDWSAGSWLAYDSVRNTIYAFKSPSNHFYKYDVKGDTWFTPELARMPQDTAVPGAGGCAVVVGGQVFALKGNSKREFYYYSIRDNAWTSLGTLPDAPANVVAGSSITTDGAFLYAEFVGEKSTVYRYAPVLYSFATPPVEPVVAAHYVHDKPFTIAPNPLTSGCAILSCNLHRAGMAKLGVYNVAGQVLLSRALSVGHEASKVALDLHQLSNGVYLVKLTSDGFAGTQKLVVRR